MRIIVPLQGIVQGRGGLILGSLIPCALLYFLQFYLKRNRSSPPPRSPSESSANLPELAEIPRSTSRSSLSARGSIRPVPVSSRAIAISKSRDSAYYTGLKKALEDPYHPTYNPDGILQLGLAENQLSLDIIGDWIAANLQKSLLGEMRGDLNISGLAAYEPLDGLWDLKIEIHDLLLTWKPYINSSSCIFVYAPSKNRQIIFDAEKQNLHFSYRVTRQIPLTVRRPTLKEAKRIYLCLTQLTFEVDENSPPDDPNLRVGDEEKNDQLFHESRIIKNLEVMTSSPLLGSTIEDSPSSLANISLSDCENKSTSLHEAAQSGNAQWTLELLEQGCSPCLKDERGRTPYMLATEKEVRNTFRRFMAANLDRWDWQAAYVPSPLTKEMEESQAAKQAEKDAKRKAKAKEMKKLRKAKEKAKEQAASASQEPPKDQPLPNVSQQISEPTRRMAPSRQQPKPNIEVISKKEEEKRSLAAEREKRAAAAERRIAAMKNEGTTAISSSETKASAKDLFCSFCNSSMAGKIPFHRYNYNYCSTSCMHVHREVLQDG